MGLQFRRFCALTAACEDLLLNLKIWWPSAAKGGESENQLEISRKRNRQKREIHSRNLKSRKRFNCVTRKAYDHMNHTCKGLMARACIWERLWRLQLWQGVGETSLVPTIETSPTPKKYTLEVQLLEMTTVVRWCVKNGRTTKSSLEPLRVARATPRVVSTVKARTNS